jgi:rubredoxin
MTIQFPCPEGHLLEAEESAAGQPCSCPTCGAEFVIPSRPIAGSSNESSVDAPPIILTSPAASVSSESSGEGADSALRLPPAGSRPNVDVSAPPRILHIPCPNGHELETPHEMLDQHVMCPHCGVQYRLREQDSVEYRRMQQDKLEAKERKTGKIWLNWAVLITVLVLLGLLAMILSTSG